MKSQQKPASGRVRAGQSGILNKPEPAKFQRPSLSPLRPAGLAPKPKAALLLANAGVLGMDFLVVNPGAGSASMKPKDHPMPPPGVQ